MSTIQSVIQNVSSTTTVSTTTIATPLGINATTVNSTLPSSNLTLSPTMQPYWNISDSTGSYWNITGYGNYSSNWTSYPGEWQPYYPPCTSCYPSVVVTPSYSYSYFSYAYVYVLFLLLLLAVSLILIKLAVNRRREAQRQLALQQARARQNRQNAQSGYMNTNSTLNIHEETCCNAAPTKSPGDCPPAYDDIIPAAAGGAATSENGPNNTGIATITIENAGAVNASTNQAAGATAAATASGTSATTVIDIVATEKTNPKNAV